MTETILTLFSSNSTLQYTKDIFSVLSLPRNSVFQFRYQTQHVENSVKPLFENELNVAGTRALVAFRSGSREETDKTFIVPIRWVEITSVKHFSDVYTVYFKLMGYPSFSQAFKNTCTSFTSINSCAKTYFVNNRTDIAVQPTHLDSVDLRDDSNRDTENWRSIVEVLTKIPSYENYHFLKCSSFYTEKMNGKSKRSEHNACPIEDGRCVLTEGQCANLDIEYYSASYDMKRKRRIDVFVDENVLRKAKGLRTVLQSRYGSIKLGFQPQKTANNTLSEVIICTASEPTDDIQTDVVFPIINRKNRLYKIRKAVIMGIGAALVASPGLLGNTVGIAWNIVFALTGVFVLGVNNYLESKE